MKGVARDHRVVHPEDCPHRRTVPSLHVAVDDVVARSAVQVAANVGSNVGSDVVGSDVEGAEVIGADVHKFSRP